MNTHLKSILIQNIRTTWSRHNAYIVG